MIGPMPKSTKQWIVASAAAGTLLGAVGVAMAATGGAPTAAPKANDEVVFASPVVATQQTPSTTAPPNATKPDKPGKGGGGHAAETPLTGDTAEKVKAAALAAVPG